MCLVHKQPVNAQLLESHDIVFFIICLKLFKPGFQAALGSLQLLDGEPFCVV